MASVGEKAVNAEDSACIAAQMTTSGGSAEVAVWHPTPAYHEKPAYLAIKLFGLGWVFAREKLRQGAALNVIDIS
jgi:hypothetical protein